MISTLITYFIIAALWIGCLRIIYRAFLREYRDDQKGSAVGLFIVMLLLSWFIAHVAGV